MQDSSAHDVVVVKTGYFLGVGILPPQEKRWGV